MALPHPGLEKKGSLLLPLGTSCQTLLFTVTIYESKSFVLDISLVNINKFVISKTI